MQRTLRSMSLCAAAVILLLAFSGNLVAGAAPPACPGTGTITNTWGPGTGTDGITATITATTPQSGAICNGACCQTITISGLPSGWTLTGTIESKFLFTTECKNGVPVPPQAIDTFNIAFTSNGVDPFTQKVCYPSTSGWPSFEIHIDMSLTVKDTLGNVATFVGNDLVGAAGVIGPGNGGNTWDPVCYNTNCTPGFWKNHCNSGCNKTLTWPGGLLPGNFFDVVFGVGNACIPSTETLIGALGPDNSLSPNGQKQMAFQCTAALLNSVYAGNIIAGTSCIDGGTVCQVFGGAEPPASIINEVQSACSGNITLAAAANFCAFFAADSLCPFDGAWLNTCNGRSECAAIDPGTSCNPNVP